MGAEYCIAYILVIATLRSPSSDLSLALPCLALPCLALPCLALPCLAFCVFLCFDYCPCFPGFTLSLALWTLFASRLDYCCLPGLSLFALPLLDIVCQSSTHASPKDYAVSCPCHTCLLFIDPACIKTMFWNKASQMDLHVSHLVHHVTQRKSHNAYFT